MKKFKSTEIKLQNDKATQTLVSKQEVAVLVQKVAEKVIKNPKKAATVLSQWMNKKSAVKKKAA